jgi:hypothetical protein
VFYLYGFTLLFLAMGLAAYSSRGNLVPVLLGVGAVVLLLLAGKLQFSRRWFAVGRVVGDSLNMREEVQYALTLMRWLGMEGGRRNSAEELWSDLLFSAQRLGYTSVKLSLADGERFWVDKQAPLPTRTLVQPLEGGRLGTLELTTPTCATAEAAVAGTQTCKRQYCPCVADTAVFEILSDLLAEGWTKAARRLENGAQAPLRFDTKRAASRNGAKMGFPLFPAASEHVGPAGSQTGETLSGTVS